jgi:hypothetical protein
LGRDDTPPYWGHLVVNGVAVVTGVATALTGSEMWAIESATATVAHVLLAALGAWLAWNVIGVAAMITARRPA